ncbi:MAG: hypothetical protein M3Z64_01540 [Verrucomicrobiota bacterium]|nr:hypothetical protein [Verrucomicrobiota bacterium]
MKAARHRRTSGEGIVFVLIVLAIIGGGIWWLAQAKEQTEKEAKDFATEVATRLAVNYDAKFFSLHVAPSAQATYPPSYRDRAIEHFRQLGAPTQPPKVTGKVEFKSYFFEARGSFRVELDYPSAPAYMDLVVSHPKALWQIDGFNLTWTAAPD